MAYQQGGYRHQGQYGSPQGSPEVRIPHGVPPHMTQPTHLRRNPSFDQGDDNQYREEINGTQEERAYGARGYRTSSSASTQHSELFMGGSNQPNQSPGYSSPPARGGYRHQNVPPAPPTAQPLYNPQQYGPSQPQYTPPLAQGPNPYNTSHQPYVPAAYQQPNTQYPPGYGSQPSQNYLPASQSQYQPNNPPPPPPRNHEQRYSN
ncbi:MAG: hypothetical protein Q9190_006132, partial [Brigantiaea leucoxantha]